MVSKWRINNPERAKAYAKEYSIKHREQNAANTRKYYAKFTEEQNKVRLADLRIRAKNWALNNPEKAKANKLRWYEKRKAELLLKRIAGKTTEIPQELLELKTQLLQIKKELRNA